jgi:hypothetical protein
MNSFNHRSGSVFIFIFFTKLNSVLTQAVFAGTSPFLLLLSVPFPVQSLMGHIQFRYWEYLTCSSGSPVLAVNGLDVFNSGAELMIVVTILRCNSSSGV